VRALHCGESSAKNLLPQLYGTEINQIDLERMIVAQAKFAKRLLKENLSCDWECIMKRLNLRIKFPISFIMNVVIKLR